MTRTCSTAFASTALSKPFRTVSDGSFCASTRPNLVVPRKTQKVTVTMALNAKNMMKNKKGGKKGKGKGKSGGSNATARAGNTQVDTNRREYIYQMRNVNKVLGNGKQVWCSGLSLRRIVQ